MIKINIEAENFGATTLNEIAAAIQRDGTLCVFPNDCISIYVSKVSSYVVEVSKNNPSNNGTE